MWLWYTPVQRIHELIEGFLKLGKPGFASKADSGTRELCITTVFARLINPFINKC